MSLSIRWTNQFRKDYKKVQKSGLDINKLKDVIKQLSEQTPLPEHYKVHQLLGNYNGYRECHIQPDWLLIYYVDNENLILVLSRTGTHSDLFG